jgi:deoxyadenosine/deoxycytidine kinase
MSQTPAARNIEGKENLNAAQVTGELKNWATNKGSYLEADEGVTIISLDGNIGAGKSTLLEAIRKNMPDVEVVQEPVGEWSNLKDKEGKTLLQLFYEDKKRWSYTFQNCAILTRLNAIKKAIAGTTKKVLITERSVLTDRFVFAQMLHDSGDLSKLEWELYLKWYDTFAIELPLKAVIHVTTGVACSSERIVTRGRQGESSIPMEYLTALDDQHHKWLAETELQVLRLSTEKQISLEDNLQRIREFVDTVVPPSRTNSPVKKKLRKEPLTDKTNIAPAQSPFVMNGSTITV